MPRGFENKEIAKMAGQKGKPGKHEKTKKIEALLEALEGKHSERFDKILSKMPDEEFARFYKDLIKYVAPIKTHNINEERNPTVIVYKDISGKIIDKDG